MDDASGDNPTPCDGAIDCVDREAGFQPVRDGMPDDAPGEQVFDGAKVDFPLPGAMFGDIHQSKRVGFSRSEVAFHQVATDWRSGYLALLVAGFHHGGHDVGLPIQPPRGPIHQGETQ